MIYANGRPVSTSTIHKRHTRFAKAFIRIKNKNQFFAYCIINAINTKLGNSAATLEIFCSSPLHLFYMSSNLFSCLPFFSFSLSLSPLISFHLRITLHLASLGRGLNKLPGVQFTVARLVMEIIADVIHWGAPTTTSATPPRLPPLSPLPTNWKWVSQATRRVATLVVPVRLYLLQLGRMAGIKTNVGNSNNNNKFIVVSLNVIFLLFLPEWISCLLWRRDSWRESN